MSRTETTQAKTSQATPRSARGARNTTSKATGESTLKPTAEPRTRVRKPAVDNVKPTAEASKGSAGTSEDQKTDPKTPGAAFSERMNQFSGQIRALAVDQLNIDQRRTVYSISLQELKVAATKLELEHQEIHLAQLELDAKAHKLGFSAIIPITMPEFAPVAPAAETAVPQQ